MEQLPTAINKEPTRFISKRKATIGAVYCTTCNKELMQVQFTYSLHNKNRSLDTCTVITIGFQTGHIRIGKIMCDRYQSHSQNEFPLCKRGIRKYLVTTLERNVRSFLSVLHCSLYKVNSSASRLRCVKFCKYQTLVFQRVLWFAYNDTKTSKKEVRKTSITRMTKIKHSHHSYHKNAKLQVKRKTCNFNL